MALILAPKEESVAAENAKAVVAQLRELTGRVTRANRVAAGRGYDLGLVLLQAPEARQRTVLEAVGGKNRGGDIWLGVAGLCVPERDGLSGALKHNASDQASRLAQAFRAANRQAIGPGQLTAKLDEMGGFGPLVKLAAEFGTDGALPSGADPVPARKLGLPKKAPRSGPLTDGEAVLSLGEHAGDWAAERGLVLTVTDRQNDGSLMLALLPAPALSGLTGAELLEVLAVALDLAAPAGGRSLTAPAALPFRGDEPEQLSLGLDR